MNSNSFFKSDERSAGIIKEKPKRLVFALTVLILTPFVFEPINIPKTATLIIL
jgi:hypothetical protein